LTTTLEAGFRRISRGTLTGSLRASGAPTGDWPLRLAGLAVAGSALLPVVYLVVRAVGAGGQVWRVLLRPDTLEVAARSAALALLVMSAATALGVPLAWLTERTDLPGRRVWTALLALPLAIPSYVGAFAIIAAFGPRGMLHSMLEGPLGIRQIPSLYGLPGAWLALTLFTYPYVFLSVRASLRSLDPTAEEAARGLGSGTWSVFRRVTLPQLRPAIGAGGLLVALYSLSDFGAVSLMRFNSFTRVIYLHYLSSFDRSLAAALALVLVAMTIGLLAIERRLQTGQPHATHTATGSARRRIVTRLGAARWPALALCAAVVGTALLVPVSVVSYWLVRGIASGEALGLVWAPTLRSGYASALAAGLAMVCSVPVAVLAVRRPGRFSTLVERSTYCAYALPGVVVALAMVSIGARHVPWAYQTLGMLVFAYVVRFLPQAVGASRTSLLSVSLRMEEAARGLGRRPLGVLTTITLPLMRSGLATGTALVFLTAMKELPATLLLAPIGFDTLATRIWTAASAGFYARAAPAALMLILVAGLPMLRLLHDSES
jgi:iron(III) transport system permease protein